MDNCIKNSLDDINFYLEVASGHSCKQCSAPTDEMLVKAIRAVNTIRTKIQQLELK